jgi:short-subunit dehydrogenase
MTRVAITGCSTGIGRALAIEFAERGCVVLATARNVKSIADLKERGIHTASADVCTPESLAKAIAKFGGVDICVANAGISGFSPLIDQEIAHIEQVLRTNSVGVVATAQAVAPAMISKGSGLLVVTGSVSGKMVTPFAGAYCASKAAVTALCDALRMELAPFGVGVLEVITGAVRSNFSANAMEVSKLPVGSRYASLQKFVDARAGGSQGPGAIDAADYARTVVDAALASDRLGHTQLIAGGMARKCA